MYAKLSISNYSSHTSTALDVSEISRSKTLVLLCFLCLDFCSSSQLDTEQNIFSLKKYIKRYNYIVDFFIIVKTNHWYNVIVKCLFPQGSNVRVWPLMQMIVFVCCCVYGIFLISSPSQIIGNSCTSPHTHTHQSCLHRCHWYFSIITSSLQ